MTGTSATMRWIGLSMLCLLLLCLSACGSSSPTPGALAGKTAAEAMQLALHDAATAGTMRFSIRTQGTGVQQSVLGEAGPTQGDVVVSNSTSDLRIVVNGNVGYVESDAVAGLQALGLSTAPAESNLNRWISLTPADTPYTSLATSVSLSATLDEFTPGGHLSLSEKVIDGHTVGLISGTGSADLAVQSYHVQLAVTTSSPIVPIGGAVRVQANGKTVTQTAVFEQWGRPLGVTVPANATPLSSLVTS